MENDPADADVEHSFGGPQLVHRHTRERHGPQLARRQDHVAERRRVGDVMKVAAPLARPRPAQAARSDRHLTVVCSKLQRHWRMLHVDPQEIEAGARHFGRGIEAARGDRDTHGGAAVQQETLDRVLPRASAHRSSIRISHTSATWHPRPDPPRPASCVHVSVSSPPCVAAAGISNSSGRTGSGFGIGA